MDQEIKSILVKYPTRQRPAQFLETLRGWVDKQDGPNVTYLISYDVDDETMTPEVIKEAESLAERVILVKGSSQSKIDACNRDIERYTQYFPQWGIILLVSDDMICNQEGWDNIIRKEFETHYPDTDGCIWFHDGSKQKVISTLSCMGRKYYDRFGYVYHPDYKSFFCDNEYTEIAQKYKKIIFVDTVLARHEHPNWLGGHKDDALYQRNQPHWKKDSALYYDRKAKGFPALETIQI